MHDFLIVGGGINGLLLARELVTAQADVVLVEQGVCGMEASWAGGGIVSPLYPWRYAAAVTALASWAQDFYPALVAALHAETGIDAQLQRTGLLMLDADDAAAALAWAGRHGRRVEQLDTAMVSAREPNITRALQSALWMPDVANVRNPRLLKALVASLRQHANLRILEQAQVGDLLRVGNAVRGVEIQHAGEFSTITARATIICAGAWSSELLQATGVQLPIFPVKGQMLLFKLPPARLQAIVLAAGRYLIPRCDGYLLAGSTLEHSGFDKQATRAAHASLYKSACALLPELAQQQPIAQWAGLRPGSPHGIPFIGAVPNSANLYVNAGQFRNGLVLAPASARLLADQLLQRTPIIDPAPYLPARPLDAI